ncbi:MAG TPA: winged helix DNA-binding domain-containing protein [Solirubrobacterales bacterium]|nr:winged helix DNA-binding domain-containing protein [Solirubrobacterales bacterium]
MAGGERTLSQRELNRALLARQLLLEPGRGSLPRTLERIGGIQAQYAPSMYIGLFARLDGFEREALTQALERRAVAQGTSLRSTIHLLSPAQWWRYAIAIRKPRRESWLAYRKEFEASQLDAAARRARKALAGGRTLARKDLQDVVGLGAQSITGINAWLDLVRVPPSGTWERRRADVFALAEDWLGEAPRIAVAEARNETVRDYLRAFGPATPGDVASWSGLTLRQVRAALDALELRRFRDEHGAELVDLPRQPLPDPETPAPVRFLPTWDATLLAHCRRTQILPEEYRPRVFSVKTPQSVPTFTVDGAVAGTWKYVRGSIRVEPFARLDRAAQRELDAEAERLAAFHAE